MSGEATVGSIVGYLRLDTSAWRRELDEAAARADALGRHSPDIRIRTNAPAAAAELAMVGRAADQAKAPTIGLWSALTALAPAAVPIAAVAGGALLGLAPAAVTAALGVAGVVEQFKSGQLEGTKYGADIKSLQGEFQHLKNSASSGLLSGLDQSMASLRPQFATVNGDVKQMSAQIGAAASHAIPALVTILTELNPLFVTFGNMLVSGAEHLEHWASSTTGIHSFVSYVQAELPQVTQVLGNLVTLFAHIAEASAPMGGAILGGIGVLARVLNSLPISVLQVLIPLLESAYISFKAFQGITFLVGVMSSVSAAYRGAGAAAQGTALQIAASAAEIEAATAAEVATVAAAKAAEAEAFAATAVEIAASVEGTSSILAAGATATAEAAIEEAAAFQLAADAAVASSIEIAAASLAAAEAADAEALAIMAAGRTASLGWAAMLGPIGAVAVGVGILTMAMRNNKQSAVDDRAAVDGYVQALITSKGAIDANVRAQVAKKLADDGTLQSVKTLGLSLPTFLNAVTGSGDATGKMLLKVAALNPELNAMRDNGDKLTTSQKGLLGAQDAVFKSLSEQHDAFDASRQKAVLEAESVDGVSAAMDNGSAAIARHASTLGLTSAAYLTARDAAKASADQTNAQAAAFKLADDAANLLKLALDNLSGKQLSAAQTQNAFEQSLVSMVKHVGGADSALTGMSSAAIQNRGDLINLTTSASTAAEAYGNLHKSSETGRQKLIQLRTEIINNAVANGENRVAVTKYVDSILKIPPKATTKGVLETTAAEDDLAHWKRALAQLSTPVTTAVHLADTTDVIAGLSNISNLLAYIKAGAHVDIGISGRGEAGGTDIGKVHPATGGYITGPGSGTSDSIPAMISNGEYVINAAATKRNRALLDAINSGSSYGSGGEHHYASGGLVTITPKKSKSGGSAKVKRTRTKSPVIDSLSATAGGGAAYGIAQIVRGQIPQAKIAAHDLAMAVTEAFSLKGISASLASTKKDLANLVKASAQLHSAVTGTLAGSVDPTKFADVSDMLGALGAGTSTNRTFTSEISKLSKEHLNASLLKQLALAGPSAGLDALAGASRGEIAQTNKAYSAYIASANKGGATAANSEYGAAIAHDRAQVSRLTAAQTRQVHAIDKLVSAIAKQTKRPVEIKLNDKVLAKAVFSSKEFEGVIDSITHHLVYG